MNRRVVVNAYFHLCVYHSIEYDGWDFMLDMILLVLATGCDSFFMSVAYGVEGIKIPKRCILMIAFCSTFFLSISMYMASLLTDILPNDFGRWLSFAILCLLGLMNLFQGQVKRYVRKYKKEPLIIRFQGISFVIDIFLDEKEADCDHSKELSLKEALYLGVALSMDSLASGLAYGIGFINIQRVIVYSFVMGILLIISGSFIGRHISSHLHFDVSCIAGCMLIVLAFLRLT